MTTTTIHPPAILDASIERPSDLAIIQCIADEFDVQFHVAADWIVSVGVEHGEAPQSPPGAPAMTATPADPCPQCRRGGVCKTPLCGRLMSIELMSLYGIAAPTKEST